MKSPALLITYFGASTTAALNSEWMTTSWPLLQRDISDMSSKLLRSSQKRERALLRWQGFFHNDDNVSNHAGVRL